MRDIIEHVKGYHIWVGAQVKHCLLCIYDYKNLTNGAELHLKFTLRSMYAGSMWYTRLTVCFHLKIVCRPLKQRNWLFMVEEVKRHIHATLHSHRLVFSSHFRLWLLSGRRFVIWNKGMYQFFLIHRLKLFRGNWSSADLLTSTIHVFSLSLKTHFLFSNAQWS